MKTWQEILLESPAEDLRMDPERARAMRRIVVAVAADAEPMTSPWPLRVAAAGVMLAFLTAGAGDHRGAAAPSGSDPVRAGERRQIQFATPGGTRIIWELNPEFTLGEALP
jgi:hypothetical protein